METLASTFVYRHTRIRIATERPTEFIDLTEGLESLVAESGLTVGLINVQSLHTTAGIVVNEHEPQLLHDFATVLDSVAPRGGTYLHDSADMRALDATERPNGHSHCQSLLLGSSVCLNVVEGRLLLGRWQRVFLVELDGPRPREIAVVLFGGSSR